MKSGPGRGVSVDVVQICVNQGVQHIYIVFIILFFMSSIMMAFIMFIQRDEANGVPYQISNIAIMFFTYSFINVYLYQVNTGTILIFSLLIFSTSLVRVNKTTNNAMSMFKNFFWPASIELSNYLEQVGKVAVISFISLISVALFTNIVELLASKQIVTQSPVFKYLDLNILVLLLVVASLTAIYTQLDKKIKEMHILYGLTLMILMMWVMQYQNVC